MRFKLTAAKLLIKADVDGIDLKTIEIPSGLRCSTAFFCCLPVADTYHEQRLQSSISPF